MTISGTRAVFGELIVDPIAVMGRLDNKAAVLLLGLTMLVATVGVNIVANFVSAAFDISNIFQNTSPGAKEACWPQLSPY